MINFDSIVLKLTPEEVLAMTGLAKIAEESIEAIKLISETYSFKMGEDKVVVWSDECNAEYLTIDGIWQARYLHQTYDVTCTVDKVYDLLRKEYLYKEGYIKTKEYEDKKQVAGYFRAFINKTRQKAEEKNKT